MNASTRTTQRRVRSALRASFAALSLSLVAAGSVRALPAFASAMPARSQEAFSTGASFAPDEGPTARTMQRGGISLAQATAIAQSRYGGRVVRAETVMNGDRVVHEIRILGDDGRVRTVRIDAQTGAVL